MQRKKFHTGLRILPNNTRFRKVTKNVTFSEQFQPKIVPPSKLSTSVIKNIRLFTHPKTESLLCT